MELNTIDSTVDFVQGSAVAAVSRLETCLANPIHTKDSRCGSANVFQCPQYVKVLSALGLSWRESPGEDPEGWFKEIHIIKLKASILPGGHSCLLENEFQFLFC